MADNQKEPWRLADKETSEPNTWRDAIARTEALIATGYSTSAMLSITGPSAGGIIAGHAMTERPDLFGSAVAWVTVVNTLRAEFMAAGPANSRVRYLKDRHGFSSLLGMNTVQHVRTGIRNPAVLITAGLNNSRVEPWTGARLAETLQKSK